MQATPATCPSCDNLLGVCYGSQFVQRVGQKRGARKMVSPVLPTIVVCELGDGYWRNPDASDDEVATAFRLLLDRSAFPERLRKRQLSYR